MLNYGSKQKQLVKKIDANHFLGLQNSGSNDISTPRIELFLFAMSLAIDTAPMDLDHPESFIRGEYLQTMHKAYLYSAFINSKEGNSGLDGIMNMDAVSKLSDRYANTGFNIIEDLMQKTEQNAELSLISEMDELYEKYVKPDMAKSQIV